MTTNGPKDEQDRQQAQVVAKMSSEMQSRCEGDCCDPAKGS